MKEIGMRIKKLRLQQQMTLQQLALQCKCSKSLISKIENGLINPSLSSLSNISKVLGVKISVLLEEEDALSCVFIPAASYAAEDFVKTDKGYRIYSLASNNIEKEMVPILVRGQAGKVLPHTVAHEGEEFIYMLRGQMRFSVGGVEYTVGAGDALYFNAAERHGMLPITEEIEYLDVVK